MTLTSDTWLSNALGFETFRAALNRSTDFPALQREIAAKISELKRTMLYGKIDCDDIQTLHAALNAGFSLVDINVTFERKSTLKLAALPAETIVREPRTADRQDLLEIAETAFQYSRFHLDPQVEKNLADRVKRRWIESYLDGQRGETLLVAEHRSQVAGFLAVLAAKHDGKTYHVIDLIAVSVKSRRSGVGQALVGDFIMRYASDPFVRVGTQAANLPSINLYTHMGFQLCEAKFVVHAHPRGKR